MNRTMRIIQLVATLCLCVGARVDGARHLTATSSGNLHLFPIAVAWREAADACQMGGGILAGVHAAGQQATLVELMDTFRDEVPPNQFNQRAAWIGFSRADQGGPWAWEDGSTLPFTAWGGSEPNDSNRPGPDCTVTLDVLRWKWADNTCTSKRPFICRGLFDTNATLHYAQQLKADREAAAADIGYTFIKHRATWTEAEGACEIGGGTLAGVHSQMEQDTLVDLMNQHRAEVPMNEYGMHSAWIGFSDQELEGNWDWSDGNADSNFTAWGGNEPNSWGNEDCAVALDAYGWSWGDYACGSAQPFVCRRLVDVDAVNEYMEGLDDKRHQAAQQAGFYFVPKRASWQEARLACSAGGGSLAGIHSHEEQQALVELMTEHRDTIPANQFGQLSAWLGYTDAVDEGSWAWADGFWSNFTAWGASQPSAFDRENCAVATNVFGWGWADYPCGMENVFVCRGLTDPNATTMFTDELDDVRQQAAEQAGLTFISEPATWVEARQACAAGGGTLAGIHSDDEQGALIELMNYRADFVTLNKYGQAVAWIGLNDRHHEGKWKWVDESDEDYFQWGGEEPNDQSYDGPEDCIMTMDVYGWQWGDYPCDAYLSFVCRDISADPATVAASIPTRNPPPPMPPAPTGADTDDDFNSSPATSPSRAPRSPTAAPSPSSSTAGHSSSKSRKEKERSRGAVIVYILCAVLLSLIMFFYIRRRRALKLEAAKAVTEQATSKETEVAEGDSQRFYGGIGLNPITGQAPKPGAYQKI